MLSSSELMKDEIKKFLFWPHCVTTGILVPQPGIEPTSPGVEAQSPKPLNHQGSPYKAFGIVHCHVLPESAELLFFLCRHVAWD